MKEAQPSLLLQGKKGKQLLLGACILLFFSPSHSVLAFCERSFSQKLFQHSLEVINLRELSQRSSSSYICMEAKNPECNSLKILGLHGKGGSGPSFNQVLSSFSKELQIECECPTAPFPGGKWWDQVPNGSRSYNAEAYEGYEASASMVRELLDRGHSGEAYDIAFGHSQGAILLASMMANGDFGNRTPKALILNGVAWPNPYADAIQNLRAPDLGPETPIRALFIVGQNDDINPPEGAIRVRDCFQTAGVQVTTIEHPGGHSVPTQNIEAMNAIAQWISGSISGQS
mmetsp:Transcript_17105/g.24995  ORF Transcript_17105/g.24995 Transcript_17105/m.24995 type:complete len:287 (-) Transcript_17105:218-1078(-)